MEEKMKTPKNENSGWMGFLMENIFGIIRSFAENIFENAEEATFAFTRKLAKRVFLTFFACVGVVFILAGVARFLSLWYRLPGAGEVLVGAFVL